MTDIAFAGPSLRFAEHAEPTGARVWAYRLDWAPIGSTLGACHCLELPLVFDSGPAWADAPMLTGTAADTDADTAGRAHAGRAMRSARLCFAHHGHPGSEQAWPAYSNEQPHLMIFDRSSGPAVPETTHGLDRDRPQVGGTVLGRRTGRDGRPVQPTALGARTARAST